MATIKTFLEKEKLIRFFSCLAVSIVLCYLIGLFFGTLTTIVVWIAKEVQTFFSSQTINKYNYMADLSGTIVGSIIFLIFSLFL